MEQEQEDFEEYLEKYRGVDGELDIDQMIEDQSEDPILSDCPLTNMYLERIRVLGISKTMMKEEEEVFSHTFNRAGYDTKLIRIFALRLDMTVDLYIRAVKHQLRVWLETNEEIDFFDVCEITKVSVSDELMMREIAGEVDFLN